MFETLPMMAGAAAAAIVPAVAHAATEGSWSKKLQSKPSIFNQGDVLKGSRAMGLGIVVSVAAGCAIAAASLFTGLPEPRALLLAASAGFAGSLAVIDAKYRRVPVPQLIAMGACAGLATGPAAAENLLLGLGLAVVLYALSAFVGHKVGREVFGLGDVMLVAAVGAAFGTSPASWQRFLIAAVIALVASLAYMKAKDNDDMVPMFTLMLVPYLLGLTGVA